MYKEGVISMSCKVSIYLYIFVQGPSLSRSDGSWIYNYLCNQCLSPLKL